MSVAVSGPVEERQPALVVDAGLRYPPESPAIRRQARGRPAGAMRTERLDLWPISVGDLDDFAPIYADPEVMRYSAAGDPLDRAGTEASLVRLAAAWDDQRYGMFTARIRSTC